MYILYANEEIVDVGYVLNSIPYFLTSIVEIDNNIRIVFILCKFFRYR